jgi:putative heme-binding domain-containing protein
MRSRLFVIATLALAVFSARLFADTPYPHIAPTEPKTPAEELKTFTVPKGFEVQLVASEPDIRKPIQIAFDAKGRLWATTSEEYPFPAVGRPGKDRLYVMEDFGPDGKAKKVSVFADDLNIPIGVLPLPDCKSVIVSSIDPGEGPNAKPVVWICKLTDTDGDGKADKKEKLYGPFGCDDTHGMNNSYTLMPDGWVYACHGFRNDSRPKGKDGHEIHMQSGNTFRFRPDGSRIENWTFGQVNPFGIAVDPYFNLYTADCHSKPITQLIRGATYQSFSKSDDGLGFAPHVTIHGHDSTALCGLVYYAADHFPKEYRDCMFLGNVTSNCINWDRIEFKGSTPVGIDKGKFLASSDLWCRPTDIKLGPDGALYFADFYNKIIGHYEVDLKHPARDKLRGRVWRIVWKGEDGKGEAPKMVGDLTTAELKELAALLDHPCLSVAISALLQLQAREKIDASWRRILLKALTGEQTQALRVWALADDWPSVQMSLFPKGRKREEKSALVRAHAVKLLSTIPKLGDEWNSWIASQLGDEDPRVQRAAVEAFCTPRFPGNVRGLLDLYHKTPAADNHLRYAIRVALREQLQQPETWSVIPGKVWSTADDAVLADVCLAVPSARPVNYLMAYLRSKPADTRRVPDMLQHIARYYTDDQNLKPLAELCQTLSANPATRLSYYLAVKRGHDQRGAKLPEEIRTKSIEACSSGLAANDAGTVQTGIELATSLRASELAEPLIALVSNPNRAEPQRAAALPALVATDARRGTAVAVQILNDPTGPIGLRERAAQVLAGLNQDGAREELVKALQAAPARLQTSIAAALAGSQPGAEKLLKAVETGKASARLLQENGVVQKLNESKLPKAGERITALTKGLPSADQKLAELFQARSTGFVKAKPDATLGKAVFTKSCAICHQIGNEGVKIGPQLDGIGGRGLERLLEDVLDPSRNVDAAFRLTTLSLKDGKTVPGLVLREEGQLVVIADDKGKEVKVPKDDIDERRTSLLSPMPANLVETISEKDFYDLMAYLLTQRSKDKAP